MIHPQKMTNQEIYDHLTQPIGSIAQERVATYILKTYGAKISQLVYQYKGKKEDAQDVFQMAYQALIHQIEQGKYEHQNKFEGFFMTIATNKWIDLYRKKKPMTSEFSASDLFKLAEKQPTEFYDTVVLAGESFKIEAGHLLYLLKNWTHEVCKTRLLRRFVDGYSLDEIKILENDPNCDMSAKIYRCKEYFRDWLAKLRQKQNKKNNIK